MTQRTPRRSVPPKYIRVLVAEKTLGEERGLAGHEPLEVAPLTDAGYPPRAVAPAEETLRHDTDLVAGRQKPEHQIIVLRPGTVAIAELREHLAANHERGMHHRTLDEGVLTHAL